MGFAPSPMQRGRAERGGNWDGGRTVDPESFYLHPDEATSHSTKLANYASQVAGYNPPLKGGGDDSLTLDEPSIKHG